MNANTLTSALIGLCLGTTAVCARMFWTEIEDSRDRMEAQKEMQRSVRLLHDCAEVQP